MKINFIKKKRKPIIKVYAKSDVGKRRKENEDSFSYSIPFNDEIRKEYGSIFVVADGVGGTANGKIASKITCHSLIKSYFLQPRELSIDQRLKRAVEKTNELVLKKAQELNSPEMASTVTAAVFLENEVYVANVGDSRTYLINPHSKEPMKQITRDHSLVETQVRKGLITKDEADNAKNKNIITRAIGMDKKILVDIFRVPLTEKSKFLLTTDGLVRVVKDSKIFETIKKNKPSIAVNKLVKLANDNGGPDNITVCLVEKATPSLLPYILIPSVIAALLLAGYFGLPYIKEMINPSKIELLEPENNKQITDEEFTKLMKEGLALSWKELPLAKGYHLYVYQYKENDEKTKDSIKGSIFLDSNKNDTFHSIDTPKDTKSEYTYTIPKDKLFKGFNYSWYVVPVDSEGKEIEKFKSNEWKFTMPLLEKPELIEPKDNQNDVSLTPTFKWKYKDENYIDRYILYIVDDEASEKEIIKLEINKNSKSVKRDSSVLSYSLPFAKPSDPAFLEVDKWEPLSPDKTYIWNVEALKYSVNGKLSANIKGDKRTFTTKKESPSPSTQPKENEKTQDKTKEDEKNTKDTDNSKKGVKTDTGSATTTQPPEIKETGKLLVSAVTNNKPFKVYIDGKESKENLIKSTQGYNVTIDDLKPGKHKIRIEIEPKDCGWFYEKEVTIEKGKETKLTINKSDFKVNVIIYLTFKDKFDKDNSITLKIQKKADKGNWITYPPIEIYSNPYINKNVQLPEGEYKLLLEKGSKTNDKITFTIKFGEKPKIINEVDIIFE